MQSGREAYSRVMKKREESVVYFPAYPRVRYALMLIEKVLYLLSISGAEKDIIDLDVVPPIISDLKYVISLLMSVRGATFPALGQKSMVLVSDIISKISEVINILEYNFNIAVIKNKPYIEEKATVVRNLRTAYKDVLSLMREVVPKIYGIPKMSVPEIILFVLYKARKMIDLKTITAYINENFGINITMREASIFLKTLEDSGLVKKYKRSDGTYYKITEMGIKLAELREMLSTSSAPIFDVRMKKLAEAIGEEEGEEFEAP